MVNSKRSGTEFERAIVRLLNRLSKKWKWNRIAGSGALGSNLKEPSLMGDIVGKNDLVPFSIRGEVKFGYGGSKQFTLRKEWLDKIKSEAGVQNDIPVLIARFKGSRTGVSEFVVMALEDFVEIADLLATLYETEV